MKRRKPSKNLLFLSILTVITVFAWIGFDTYRALTKKDIPEVLREQLEPLDPTLNVQLLKDLSTRKNFTKADVSLSAGSTAPTPTPASNL